KHFIGRRVSVADKVRDTTRDDPSLARSRTGEDQQRPFDVKNSLPLFRVEALEKLQASILLSLTSPGSSVDRRRSPVEQQCRRREAEAAAPSRSASTGLTFVALRGRCRANGRESSEACRRREWSVR